MSSWHNRFGEDGQRLTILSVLPRSPVDPMALDADTERSLDQAIAELFRIAGEDGQAQVVLDVTAGDGSEPDFTTEQNVSLQELAARLYGSYGPDGHTVSFLRILKPGDDPFGTVAPSGQDSGEDDSGRGALAALRRLREAVHHLFGGSVEQGTPPTVLSLLVDPRAVATPRPPGEPTG